MKRHTITTEEMQEIQDTEHVIQIASSTSGGKRKRVSMYIFHETIAYNVYKGNQLPYTYSTLDGAVEKYNEL